MEFKNPEIPEGINVSDEHPLKSLVQLVLGVIAVIAIVLVVLHYSVQYLVQYIPFEFEVEMTNHIDFLDSETNELSDIGLSKQQELQVLADALSAKMQLPDEMKIIVHYSSEDIVNAFATLGGHVFIYQGLLDTLKSEQALSMVMAHEIAHIQLRHPINSIGKGVALMTLGAVITGATGSSAGQSLINSSSNLGLMKFSRDQESNSDLLAAHAIQAYYGNIAGAEDLFKSFELLAVSKTATIFSSHPHSDNRWKALADKADRYNWVTEGGLRPISNSLLLTDDY